MCGAIFDASQYRERLKALEARIAEPNFWNNQEAAQSVLRERKHAEDQITADAKLTSLSSDIETYIHLAQEETNVEQKNDLLKELDRELSAADAYISELETRTLLSGETDHLNAIMTIKPGAGGTESQDWASILLRMYLRWAERRGMTAEILDETPGEEAGIKSATIQFSGENAYGLLAGETGVHRLVRISPFDQAARRHTSFASVFVIPEIDDRIEINIRSEDLRVDTFRSGGKGGQKRLIRLGWGRVPVLLVVFGILSLSVFLPYSILLKAALSQAWALPLTWDNFTLKNFSFAFFEYGDTQLAIYNTFKLGILTATVGTLLATLIAYITNRNLFRGARFLSFFALAPLVIPGVVLAVGLFIAYTRPPLVLYGTIWILFVAFLTKEMPIGFSQAESTQATRSLI